MKLKLLLKKALCCSLKLGTLQKFAAALGAAKSDILKIFHRAFRGKA